MGNYFWDTSNPSKQAIELEVGNMAGGAWHVIYRHKDQGPTPKLNVGLGKSLGFSFGENYVSLNIGFAIASPVTVSVPEQTVKEATTRTIQSMKSTISNAYSEKRAF